MPAARQRAISVARRIPLGDHRADEHEIRPGQILVAQLPHVHVHQALRPRLPAASRPRSAGPSGGSEARLADEFQGVLETPESVRKARIEQQNLHIRFSLRVL
ncbi:MAG: hypothetical protein MZV64_06595 [Ignavibacteriales bacterium]|nr:hypothetical protein [Ignavibacteriales bacterium]